jgi:hypothetical protein
MQPGLPEAQVAHHRVDVNVEHLCDLGVREPTEVVELDGAGLPIVERRERQQPFIERDRLVWAIAGDQLLVEGDRARAIPALLGHSLARVIDQDLAHVARRDREEVHAISAVATFREIVLTPGMRVAIHGVAMVDVVDQGGERGYRDSAPTRTRLVAHPDYPIAIGKPRAP